MPPQARLDDSWLVIPAKSPWSISAVFTPFWESDAADTAPLIPPPTTNTSKVSVESFSILVVLSCIGSWQEELSVFKLMLPAVKDWYNKIVYAKFSPIKSKLKPKHNLVILQTYLKHKTS